MKKTPSLFKRDYDNSRLVYNEVVEGSCWVLRGEGVATLKLDGTSCMIRDGKLYRRFDRKLNKKAGRRKRSGDPGPWRLEDFKAAPEGFEPCEPEPNQHTGHWPGWVPVGEGPQDQHHREAFAAWKAALGPIDISNVMGTYELVGPAIQGNPYGLDRHVLWPHGEKVLDAPRDFEGLHRYLQDNRIEGIVWHHPDGRMVKLKRRDFGYDWP